MIRRALLVMGVGFMVLSFGLIQGCGTPVYDGIPVSISPPVIQMRVNQVVSVLVTLSRPRDKAGKLYIIIDNPSVLLPASSKTEIEVPAGQATVNFSIQGIGAGRTLIRARMENEGEVVSTQVEVLSN